MQDPANRHVPDWLRKPENFVAFKKELLNALTCCEAVELPEWNANNAQSLVREARRKGRSTVSAVSLPSTEICTQRFMAFEAKESDGRCTYLLAFRNDPNCYHDMLSDRSVINDKCEVNKSLYQRVDTLREPLRSLPLQWHTELQEGDRLILTGYSVAGAVAAIATFNFLESDPHLHGKICCYTFGAPLQGDERYASCINEIYASNFYHVMIEEDTVPRILTLTSTVAGNKPDVASEVLDIICKGLERGVEVAATVALNAIAPGVGNAVAAIRGRLEDGIKNLVRTESRMRESRMPMLEYNFGGTLVVLDSKRTLKFLPKEFNGMFFRFQENVESLDEEKVRKSHLLKSFSERLIDHVKTSSPALNENSPTTSSEHNQTSEKFNRGTRLRDTNSQDGVSRVAKSTTSSVKSFAASCVGQPQVLEDEKKSPRYLLEPRFDVHTPMIVWYDNNKNISIEVYGENMVLGIHVLYFVDGKEKLRVRCEDSNYMLRSVDNSTGPEQHARSKLLFRTRGFNGVKFEEPSGYFKVHLAFGESELISTDRVKKSHSKCSLLLRELQTLQLFDPMDELKVAPNFATMRPSKLIDLLTMLGTATAQVQCTLAYYAIQKDPQGADLIVETTLHQLHNVPLQEFTLLDELLTLRNVSLVSPSSMPSLRQQVVKTATDVYHGTPRTKPQQPCSPSGDEKSAPYTFRGCYTHVINRMITKKMLSKKKLAEQLGATLTKELSEPKEKIIEFLDQQWTYKEFQDSYAFAQTRKWKNKKMLYSDSFMISSVAGSSVPLLGLPIGLFALGAYYDKNFLKNLGIGLGATLGLVPGSLSAGVVGTALWLFHLTSSSWKKRPGLLADFKRRKRSANYEQKLQAATQLLGRKYNPPGVACQLEYALYEHLNHLKDPYTLESMNVKEARYEDIVALQMVNFGLAGSKMCENRRHLTARFKTTLGLVGSTRAGKSTFASSAFQVPSHDGPEHDDRTRVLRSWDTFLPGSNPARQFTLFDFPGSTDHAAANWCIRGESLAMVLVVFLKMEDMNKPEAHALVGRVCKLRRKKIPILLCITCADEELERYERKARVRNDGTKAEDLFKRNFNAYSEELLEGVAEVVEDAEEQLDYIRSHMWSCCFINGLDEDMTRKLHNLDVQNVEDVKKWCVDELQKIKIK